MFYSNVIVDVIIFIIISKLSIIHFIILHRPERILGRLSSSKLFLSATSPFEK